MKDFGGKGFLHDLQVFLSIIHMYTMEKSGLTTLTTWSGLASLMRNLALQLPDVMKWEVCISLGQK